MLGFAAFNRHNIFFPIFLYSYIDKMSYACFSLHYFRGMHFFFSINRKLSRLFNTIMLSLRFSKVNALIEYTVQSVLN
ncbi:MAG: hypothetical protein H6Q14_984 [Bacteroidetes bacterium]|nr:hypothetical protein [Bacteroidota bacterium]